MAQPFEKGSLIVLVLLVAVTALVAFDSHRNVEADKQIVAETDARTEYLRDQVEALSARVKKLEEAQSSGSASAPAPAAAQ